MDPCLISVRDLHHIYPGNVEALKGINLTITDCDVLGVIGRNGGGKTTLVKHFNGLLLPTTGEILLMGESTKEKKVSQLSKYIGYVFQNPDQQLFLPSVDAEMRFGLTNIGVQEFEQDEIVERILTEMGLIDKRQKHPFELTRLERKLVSIACVLAMKPRIIVFDEPTTGQDVVQTRVIIKLMHELSFNGHTIVIVSHDMSLVAELCTRVIVLSQGNLVADGTPSDIFSQSSSLLLDAGIEAPEITRIAHQSNIDKTILSVKDLLKYFSINV